jgi:hypothetical protein
VAGSVSQRDTQARTDASIIARSRHDPHAFEELFDRYWPALHAFCCWTTVVTPEMRTAAREKGGSASSVGLFDNWLWGNSQDALIAGAAPAMPDGYQEQLIIGADTGIPVRAPA